MEITNNRGAIGNDVWKMLRKCKIHAPKMLRPKREKQIWSIYFPISEHFPNLEQIFSMVGAFSQIGHGAFFEHFSSILQDRNGIYRGLPKS
jgi:hypothetical protein